jgi:uncharacterized protein YdhG (YjbR/CyaY superfamily)
MKFQTLEDYIHQLPNRHQTLLLDIQRYVLEKHAEIRVELSYQMMAFKTNHVFFYVGVFKRHIGLYPSRHMSHLIPHLGAFKYSKGAIQIPFEMSFPYHLIDLILKEENVI